MRRVRSHSLRDEAVQVHDGEERWFERSRSLHVYMFHSCLTCFNQQGESGEASRNVPFCDPSFISPSLQLRARANTRATLQACLAVICGVNPYTAIYFGRSGFTQLTVISDTIQSHLILNESVTVGLFVIKPMFIPSH